MRLLLTLAVLLACVSSAGAVTGKFGDETTTGSTSSPTEVMFWSRQTMVDTIARLDSLTLRCWDGACTPGSVKFAIYSNDESDSLSPIRFLGETSSGTLPETEAWLSLPMVEGVWLFPNTIYWLAAQADNVCSEFNVKFFGSGGRIVTNTITAGFVDWPVIADDDGANNVAYRFYGSYDATYSGGPLCGIKSYRDLPHIRDLWDDSCRFRSDVTGAIATFVDSFFFAEDTFVVSYTSPAGNQAAIVDSLVDSINALAVLSDSVIAEGNSSYYLVGPKQINSWTAMTADANQAITGNRTVDTMRMVIHIFGDDDSTNVPGPFSSDSLASMTDSINSYFDTISVFWLIDYDYTYSTVIRANNTISDAKTIASVAPDSQVNVWIDAGQSGATFDTTFQRDNSCDVTQTKPTVAGFAQSIAHEVGHFLSLGHPWDPLEQANPCDSCGEPPLTYAQVANERNLVGDGLEDTWPDMGQTEPYSDFVFDECGSSALPDTCTDSAWSYHWPIRFDTTQASADDASKTPNGWRTDTTISYFGANDTVYDGGLRFPNITLAQNDSVAFASIDFLSFGESIIVGEIVVDFWCQALDVGDPSGAVFSTYADFAGRNKTSASGDFTLTSTNWPTAVSRRSVDNLAGVVQGALTSGQWNSGDALIFLFESRDSSDGIVQFQTYDKSQDSSAVLTIVTVDTTVADNDYNYLMTYRSSTFCDKVFTRQSGWRIRGYFGTGGPLEVWRND